MGGNEHATVIGIQGVGESATVRTDDGRVIPIGEIDFGDFETQGLYKIAAEFPDSFTANLFLQIYRDSGVDVPEFLQVYLNEYVKDLQGQADDPGDADAQEDAPDSLPELPFDVQDVAPYGTLNFSEESLNTITTLFEQEGIPPPEGLESEQIDEDVAQSDESDIMESPESPENDDNAPNHEPPEGKKDKEGIPKAKVDEILKTPKYSRPDPTTYLSPKYINNHLAQFKEGVTKISYQAPSGYAGPPGGTFVMPTSVADDLITRAGGDISELERLLGLDPGDLGANPVRIDIENPTGLRMPSGNEKGANPKWVPGGYTSGGIPETIIDSPGPGQYTVRPIK